MQFEASLLHALDTEDFHRVDNRWCMHAHSAHQCMCVFAQSIVS